MALIVPDASEVHLMEALRTLFNGYPTKLGLYKNDVAIDQATVFGDLTAADFTGYAAQDITDWGAAASVANVGKTVAGAKTFTCTGGAAQTVYGYYVYRTDGGNKLLWAQYFGSSGISMSNGGPSLQITPTFTGRSQN